MLADTVEAACHTLDNPTSQRLEKFITLLINQKVEHKQLDNCDLTFSDISKIKAAFVNLLTGYHHNRIKYQNQQDPDQAPAKNEEEKAEAEKETAPAEKPAKANAVKTAAPKAGSPKTGSAKPAPAKTAAAKEKK